MHRDRDDPWGIGLSLTALARVAMVERDHVRARTLANQGLRALKDVGASRDTAATLVILATVACATGQAAIGAQLLGAVARVYPEGSAIGTERASFEQALAVVRAALGKRAVQAAWADGQQLTLDQAVDLALTMAETAPSAAGEPARSSAGSKAGALTRRERDVAALIVRGLTNREIADELVISEWTVDTHVRHILTKLDFRSRAQVAAWATERGLAPPNAG